MTIEPLRQATQTLGIRWRRTDLDCRTLSVQQMEVGFCVQVDLLLVECAVGMEPFMELSVSERLGDRVSSGNTSAGDPSGRRGAELRR